MCKSLLIVCAVLFSGCSSVKEHALTERWLPLESIRERPAFAADWASDSTITTVGKHAYVLNVDEWLGRHPVQSVSYQAIMRHEQEHARRQLNTGTAKWIARYGVDKEFALSEEKLGYYYEITERRRLGEFVRPEAYASTLAKYQNLAGNLISYDEALIWVNDVLSGKWTPPK